MFCPYEGFMLQSFNDIVTAQGVHRANGYLGIGEEHKDRQSSITIISFLKRV